MKYVKTHHWILNTGVIVSVVLALLIIVVTNAAASTGCFPDTNGHWAETFICWLYDNGIVSGYGDGTYRPNNATTRAEMSVYIQRVHELSRWGQSWSGTGDGLTLTSSNDNALVAGEWYPQIQMPHFSGNTFAMGGGALGFAIEVPGNPTAFLIKNTSGYIGANTWSPRNYLHSWMGNSGDPVESSSNVAAVFGECSGGCNGVRGSSASGSGVVGFSGSFYGGYFASESGNGVWVGSESGTNLIQGYDYGAYNTRFLVERDGDVKADGSFTSPADFAELMTTSVNGPQFEAGDVLVIGQDGLVKLSSKAYDTAVIGVFSARPGFLGDTQIAEYGLDGAEEISDENRIAVAILGIVPVKVSTENGSIEPGDLLTTSTNLGYAMKCSDKIACLGAVIGKALEGLDEGTGVIQVLVSLR